MNEPLLKIHELGKAFVSKSGEVRALERINLSVETGEIVTIVGPSGCGKSTLLSIVAGLEPSTEGEVLLAGQPVTGPGADRGMVFQRDCLFPWLTVEGNVRFGMKLSANRTTADAMAQTLSRAVSLIEAVGLKRFRHARPAELSGGMRQRASIARALLHQPRVLLMDEPFGALDAQTRETMQDLLLELAAEHQTTVLFVTHDVEEAVYLGDRVVVLAPHPGRMALIREIDFPRPRDQALKLEPAFRALRGEIRQYLYRG